MNRRSALIAGAAVVLAARSEASTSPPVMPSPFPWIDDVAFAAMLEEIHEVDLWMGERRDNLPTDYDEIDRLPSRYRRAVLRALPLTTATALLRERIRRCADADRDMTGKQRATIEDTVEMLTPELYEASFEVRETKWKNGFWQSTAEAFTWEEWGRIFGADVDKDARIFARDTEIGLNASAVGW
jgi:hypothetical protein